MTLKPINTARRQFPQLVADLANANLRTLDDDGARKLLDRCLRLYRFAVLGLPSNPTPDAADAAFGELQHQLRDPLVVRKVLARAQSQTVKFVDGLFSKRGLPAEFFGGSGARLRFVAKPAGVELAQEISGRRAAFPTLLLFASLRLSRQPPVRRCEQCGAVFPSQGRRRNCGTSCSQSGRDARRDEKARRQQWAANSRAYRRRKASEGA